MSKIETASKVSLKFTNRVALGRWAAPAEVSTLDKAHKPPPPHAQAQKEPSPGQKGPIAPTGNINKPISADLPFEKVYENDL